VGEFQAREDAAQLVQRLSEEGFTELWIADEGGPSGAAADPPGGRPLAQLPDRLRPRADPAGAPGSLLARRPEPLPGTPRGRVGKAGNLQLINELDMEDYLRGVVPNEMGPGVYPELQALKAQAVAARTYIVANLGLYSDDGFDVCDSPQCQVLRARRRSTRSPTRRWTKRAASS